MKAPDFWSRPNAPLGKLLSPLGCVYRFAGALNRSFAKPVRVDAMVLCVGNLVAGGTGKTPVALAIAAILQRDEQAFLTRGYGGRLAGPVHVSPKFHTPADVGDEALLLARAAPTWVARDRVAGARAAIEGGAKLVIMDDGHQNPALFKDISIVVIDGETGFGNGQLIPAGPLREPVATGLERADVVVIVGDDRADIARTLRPLLPVFTGRILPTADRDSWTGRRVVAFAGIGRPAKFFDTLTALGCDVAATHGFADHHPFTVAEIDRICTEAEALDATPVTTEKDAVRLPRATRENVETLPVAFVWDDADAFIRFLRDRTG
ncbi:MAG: tetraacyldisaccharide 4'-kinase [Proteobacteria bacterium]|nr:tetraacyldisaccharide 4'-kinase [Pseudomonadota bacterium]